MVSEMSIIFEYVEWQSTQTRVPSVSGVKLILSKQDLCGLIISFASKDEDFQEQIWNPEMKGISI